MVDTKAEIGSRIKLIRKQRKMTQADLANAIGSSVSTIPMYETGRREPDIETLLRIAKALGISLASLLPDEKSVASKQEDTVQNQYTGEKISSFSERFSELCKKRKVKSSVLVKELKVANQTINSWKSGMRVPKPLTISAISDFFHANAKWLIGYDVPMMDVDTSLEKTTDLEYHIPPEQNNITYFISEHADIKMLSSTAVRVINLAQKLSPKKLGAIIGIMESMIETE